MQAESRLARNTERGSEGVSRRIRSVLAIRGFRRLLVAGYLCSVGDWLALLALSGLASQLMTGYLAKSFAFSGVVLVQLLPGLVFAPIGGILADRFDRRKVMVVTDLARCGLFISIAVVGSAWWLFVANFLVGCMGMLWIPAKDSAVPNLLRRKDQVETANQLGLVITYGLAVVSGAGLYAVVTGIGPTLHVYRSTLGIANIAVIVNGVLYLASALMIATRIPEIAGRGGRPSITRGSGERQPGFLGMFRDGVQFAISTRLVRGLIIGMIGAFAAGGVVVGTGRSYANSLQGGESTFAMLFIALFVGLAFGMATAPRFARRMTHNRLFGIAIVLAGLMLAFAALSPGLAFSLLLIAAVGACAGIAFLTGVTIIGSQVDDSVRGRVNAVYQSLMKIILFGATIVVPLLVGLVRPRVVTAFHRTMIIDGTRPVLFGAGLLAALFGVVAYRQMGDRSTEPILANLIAAIRRQPRPTGGWLIAVEGNTPADTSIQAQRLAHWLGSTGRDVLLASDPALEEARLHAVLESAQLTGVRARALVAAAVRADVVERQVRPALEMGSIVVMERYVDSALAQVSAFGGLEPAELEGLADWATGRLRPDLTVLLDQDPSSLEGALSVIADDHRDVGDSLEHHWRVQRLLTEMAAADPDRYIVVDAEGDDDQVAERVRTAIRDMVAGGNSFLRELDLEPVSATHTG